MLVLRVSKRCLRGCIALSRSVTFTLHHLRTWSHFVILLSFMMRLARSSMVSHPISLDAVASNKLMLMMRSIVRKTTTAMMMMAVTVTMMRTMRMSSRFFHVAYPFWHLLTKGEC